jgi:hypothetical protein
MVYSNKSGLTRSQESYRQRKTYKNRASNSGIGKYLLTVGGFFFGMFILSVIIVIIFLYNK